MTTTMDYEFGSAHKGPEPNPKEAESIAQAERLFWSKKVCVRGFDHSLPKAEIRSALTNHFLSCGEILKVDFVPLHAPISHAATFAVVIMEGDDAEEKALQLNGTDVGGCKLNVRSYYNRTPSQETDSSDDDSGGFLFGYVVPAQFTQKPPKKKNNNKKKNKYHT